MTTVSIIGAWVSSIHLFKHRVGEGGSNAIWGAIWGTGVGVKTWGGGKNMGWRLLDGVLTVLNIILTRFFSVQLTFS